MWEGSRDGGFLCGRKPVAEESLMKKIMKKRSCGKFLV